VQLEISPEPDDAEREAIAAALSDTAPTPEPYGGAWRRAAIAEGLDPDHETYLSGASGRL
jgi:hypothetical protein